MNRLRTLAAALALTSLGTAAAGDFVITFNVPVEVSRMPQTVKEVVVRCYAIQLHDGTPAGEWSAPLSAAGSYSGTAAVTARIPAEQLWAVQIDTWSCRLMLHVVDPDYVTTYGKGRDFIADAMTASDGRCDNFDSGNGITCAAPGTTASVRVNGRLGQQGGAQ
jgi:hypothetical protein